MAEWIPQAWQFELKGDALRRGLNGSAWPFEVSADGASRGRGSMRGLNKTQPRSRKPSVMALMTGMPFADMALMRALTSASARKGFLSRCAV